MTNTSAVDHARNDGLEVIVIPDNIRAEVAGALDTTGAPIRDLGAYQDEWNDSFEFEFVEASALTASELSIFEQRDPIAAIAGGFPLHVKGVRVSKTMRPDFLADADAVGLWDPESKCIVIRRDQLGDLKSFAGTLLHEVIHAATGYDDVTRDFENALTAVMGTAAAQACANQSPPKESSVFGRWLGRK